MRIVSYNILDGGEGRADPLAEVLQAQHADIIALIEADVPSTVERIARRLSMDFVTAAGRQHSVALLSRYPIVQSINHAGVNNRLSRCFLEATILDLTNTQWPIGVVHLPAGAMLADEEARLHDLQIILDIFAPYRKANRPHVLCGDFNSNAPYQHIEITHCKLKTRQAYEANGNGLPRKVIQTVIDEGYLDTYAELHNENEELVGSFDTQNPGQRVDYIFSFGVPTVKQSWVEQDRLAKYVSDHFPIGVEI